MRDEPINKCPVCGGDLVITRLTCPKCGTGISSTFSLSGFASLKPEHIEFIKVFIKCHGNIKEVERELGISYPTVKNRLNEITRAMGYEVEQEKVQSKILDEIESRNISVNKALKLLRKLGLSSKSKEGIMEERIKILRMLEEGKITADEAAKLLDVLKEEPKHPHRMFISPHDVIDDVMDSVSHIVKGVSESIKGKLRGESVIETPLKSSLIVKSLSGDISLETWDKDRIYAEGESLRKLEREDELTIKSLSGDIEVKLPKIECLQIGTLSSNIEGNILANKINAKTLSGDIDLEVKAIEEGEFESKSGDITLAINPNSNLAIEASSFSGEVRCKLDVEIIEQEDNLLKCNLNEPKGKLSIRTASGDVVLEAL